MRRQARLGGRRRVLRSDRSARRLGSSDPGGPSLLRGVLDRVRSGIGRRSSSCSSCAQTSSRASRIPTWLGIGFATVVLGAALIVLLRRPRTAQTEVAAAVGFLLLPLVGALVGELVTGAYVERYVLAGVIGPALLIPLALHRVAGGRRSAAVAAGVGADALVRGAVPVLAPRRRRGHRSPGATRRLPGGAHPRRTESRRRRPSARLPRARALRAQLGRRPARPAERPGASSAVHGKPLERGRARRARRDSRRLRIVPYDEQQAPFLLLRTVRGDARDWIDPALDDDGARLDVVARDEEDGFTLVRVEPAPRVSYEPLPATAA